MVWRINTKRLFTIIWRRNSTLENPKDLREFGTRKAVQKWLVLRYCRRKTLDVAHVNLEGRLLRFFSFGILKFNCSKPVERRSFIFHTRP